MARPESTATIDVTDRERLLVLRSVALTWLPAGDEERSPPVELFMLQASQNAISFVVEISIHEMVMKNMSPRRRRHKLFPDKCHKTSATVPVPLSHVSKYFSHVSK